VSASPHQGDDTAARIGERLVSLRADRGLRVAELARRAGMSPSLVSQIERPGEDRFVVRRGQRPAIEIEGGVRWERLTPATLDGADVIELVSAARAESHSQASAGHRSINPTDEEARGVGARICPGRPA
jgi:hypothetical protein